MSAVRSTLVELLLSDGDLDEAPAAARRLGCHSHLWLALASRLEEMRPAEALEVYRQQVEAALGTSDRRSYGDAIALLRRAGNLFGRLGRLFGRFGRDEEFVEYARWARLAVLRRVDAAWRGRTPPRFGRAERGSHAVMATLP